MVIAFALYKEINFIEIILVKIDLKYIIIFCDVYKVSEVFYKFSYK